MGRALVDDAERTLRLVDEHHATTYIDALGKQLTAHAPGYKFPYQFKIVSDNNINAWALPGGSIYVTSGLVEAAQNEPQLAGAVAHAIAHVSLRHGTAEVSQAYADRVGSTRARPTVSDAMSRLSIGFDSNAVPLKYSREEERQAIVTAAQIMYDTSFDPRQMAQFFDTAAADRSSGASEFLNAHPDLPNRAAIVRTELRNLGPLPSNVRTDSPDFHSVKDRLLAMNTDSWPSISSKDRTRDSVTANRPDPPSTRMILYRGRDIEFRYPDNWTASDQSDSISLAPDGGFISGQLAYGMTIATFEPQNRRSFGRNSFATPGTRVDTTTLANATDQLIDHLQQSNPNMRVVRDTARRTIDGAQAMVVELTNDSPAGGVEKDWLVTVLRPDGSLRYFVGVAPQRDFNRYQSAFDQIVSSVRLLD
jgi:hypothetical protein